MAPGYHFEAGHRPKLADAHRPVGVVIAQSPWVRPRHAASGSDTGRCAWRYGDRANNASGKTAGSPREGDGLAIEGV